MDKRSRKDNPMGSTVITTNGAVGFAPYTQKKPRTPERADSQFNDSFFGELSRKARHSLEEISRTSSYPAGALLFMEDEPSQGVYVICQGSVKLLTTNSEGRTLIFKIAKRGEILGLNAALSGASHEVTAETLQPAQLAYVSREDFLKFIRETPDACLKVAQHLGRDCDSAYQLIRSIGLSNSVEAKLARFLLDWSAEGQSTHEGMRVTLALTHEEIAQLIGCSRESVSRSFSDFKRKRLVEVNGSTLLLQDKATLQNLAAI
jgi:CRP/FNR family transcriptional regulator, cyclic AMP receptor protein